MRVNDVQFRDDLYPRFEPNQSLIQKYSDSIEHLPPIKVSEDGILIDGFHRWKAYMLAGYEDIPAEIVEVESEKQLKRLAYQYNSNHGLQLSNDEKRRYAQEMYGEMTVKALADVLGVSEKTVQRWTETQAKAAKEERDRRIVELYLRAWNTQESIADVLGVDSKQTVSNIVDSSKKRQLSEFGQAFSPLIYNIWNLPKQDNDRKHFGAFPVAFMQNVLHYHTEPLDIVFDPFGGGGTTVDVCKQMFRRYYVSDRKVIPGRESDIKEHDIKDGLPGDLPKPSLVFLDPPYWKQAEGKYSEDENDLGNVGIAEFNDAMRQFLGSLVKWGVERIAIVIAPTQWPSENHEFIDHMFDFAESMTGYKVEMRYVLPYSTEQYNGNMVDIAKSERIPLNLIRDLVVWKKQ